MWFCFLKEQLPQLSSKMCWRHLTLLLSSHQQSGTFLKSRQKTFLQSGIRDSSHPSGQRSSREGTLKRQKHPWNVKTAHLGNESEVGQEEIKKILVGDGHSWWTSCWCLNLIDTPLLDSHCWMALILTTMTYPSKVLDLNTQNSAPAAEADKVAYRIVGFKANKEIKSSF